MPMLDLFSGLSGGQDDQMDGNMTDAVEIPRDGFTLKPIVFPVPMAGLAGATLSLLQLPLFAGGWMLLLFLGLILGISALLAWLIVMLVRLVKATGRRMWKKAVSLLLIVVCVLPLMRTAFLIGPYVHFGLSYPYYAMRVTQSPDGGSKRLTFDWGGRGFARSAQTDRWLVYDPTDETAATGTPPRSEDPNVWYEVEHLVGKFYLVERHQS